MNTLAIDTTNELLGIAIARGEDPVVELMTNVKRDHSSRLMPAIVAMMEKANMTPEQLEKIIVAQGPGSYTGVRIGVTTAKTMAWALQIPIYPISSLKALAYNGALFDGGYVWSFFDARRKSIFTSLYRINAGVLEEVYVEQHAAFDTFMERLKALDGRIVCLSPHLHVYEAAITESLGDQVMIPPAPFHDTRPANYIELAKQEDPTPAHLVKPNYMRMTEAEANWLKQQEMRVDKNG